jgi:hypothetical protein
VISSNTLLPYDSGAGVPANDFSGLFTGISATGANENLSVVANGIVGAGKPSDGRAMFLHGVGKLIVEGNTLSNRDTSGGPSLPVGSAAVQIAGFDGFQFVKNKMTDIKHSVVLDVGVANVCTKNGTVVGNTLSGDKAVTPLYTRCIANVSGVTKGVDLEKNTMSLVGVYGFACAANVVCK